MAFSFKNTSLFLSCSAVLSIAAFSISCAPQKDETVTECIVNEDQQKTFSGQWPHVPIPIAVEAVGFSGTEQQAILTAVSSWNDFFSTSKGLQVYFSGSSSLSTESGPRLVSSSLCSQPMVNQAGFTRRIMIYRVNSGWSFGSSAIAVTTTCPVSSSSAAFRKFTAAILEVNYQDFFIAGKPRPDLESIMTHELGHLLGLGHSCGTQYDGSSVACSNPEYQEAIMFPSLGFVGMNGQIKREIRKNDQQRANCLYGASES